jgi:hypothetical protein
MNNQDAAFDIKAWKKQKLDAIRSYHSQLIKDLGVAPTDFNMKKAFRNKQGVEVVGIFDTEFLKEKGFYFELITSDLDPIDPERKVYRVPMNPSYKDEYEINAKLSYNVPLEELRVVNPSTVAIGKLGSITNLEKFREENSPAPKKIVPLEDLPYSEMTIRDYITIHTGRTVSLKPWLNELVKTFK